MAAQVLNDECNHDSGGKTTLTHTSTLVFVGAFFLFLTLPLSALLCVCVCVSVCLLVCRALSVCCSFHMYSPPVCSALCMRVSVCLCVCLGFVGALFISFLLYPFRLLFVSLCLSMFIWVFPVRVCKYTKVCVCLCVYVCVCGSQEYEKENTKTVARWPN